MYAFSRLNRFVSILLLSRLAPDQYACSQFGCTDLGDFTSSMKCPWFPAQPNVQTSQPY